MLGKLWERCDDSYHSFKTIAAIDQFEQDNGLGKTPKAAIKKKKGSSKKSKDDKGKKTDSLPELSPTFVRRIHTISPPVSPIIHLFRPFFQQKYCSVHFL